MENVRLFLIVALFFLGLSLYQAWQDDYGTPPAPLVAATAETPAAAGDVPAALTPSPAATPDTPQAPATATTGVPDVSAVDSTLPVATATADPASAATDLVLVETDTFSATISTRGAALERTLLRQYPVDADAPDVPVELLGVNPPRVYVLQGGLAGQVKLPNHHDEFRPTQSAYTMAAGSDELEVPLTWDSGDGVTVTKTYVFRRGSYVVDVHYDVSNNTQQSIRIHNYEQLKRNEESSRQGMIYTFTGPALSTPEKRFEKFDIDDLRDQPIEVTAENGWVGVLQHYFVAALMPPADLAYQFYSKVLPQDIYLVGFLSPASEIAAGETARLTSSVFIGPKSHERLGRLTEGLDLSVDYGVLWFIAKPLFITLRFLHDLFGNWGWAIIVLTILLKLMFYPLSAAGYRSMANMRKVQPRMLALRDRYKDDKQQLNQAMMQLYKDEKINPLGGCLPILIQIPVFIALYWVLLESVEMRQVPFTLWITDLSTRDPYFVLPLLMGISMWAQQKLNPAPLDPIQAKVMQILPIVFTVFFAFFPSGLVLYWLVNNILSIAQQWHITRAIEAADG